MSRNKSSVYCHPELHRLLVSHQRPCGIHSLPTVRLDDTPFTLPDFLAVLSGSSIFQKHKTFIVSGKGNTFAF